jgi:hypothetical protein
MFSKPIPKSLIPILLVSGILLLTLSFSATTIPHTQAQTGASIIESDANQVVQNGTWNPLSIAEASAGSVQVSSGSLDDSLVLEFHGTSVEIIYVTDVNYGDFAIEIDNTLRRTVVTASDTPTLDNHAVIDYLDDDHHTLRVYPVSGVIAIDAFVASPMQPRAEANREEVAPILNAPLGSITDPMPTFEWNEVSGMTWYRFYISKPSGVVLDTWYEKGNSIMSCNGATCAVTPLLGLTNGSYTWYIRGWAHSGYSDWSSVGNFSVNLPAPNAVTIITPTDTTTSTTPYITFEWNHDSNAAWYQVLVNGAATWYDSPTYCTTTCTSTKSFANGNYSWKIRAYGPGGYGNWSADMTFTLDVPTPAIVTKTAPAESSTLTTTNVTFQWDHDPNASWYQFNVAGVSTWYDAAIYCTTVCTFNKTLGNGNYKWYVRAYGPGNYGGWGSGFAFTVAVPKPALINLTAPIGTISDPTPDFTWQEDSNATWYNVYIGGPSGQIHNDWHQGTAVCASGTCTLPAPTTFIGNFSWYVRGWGPGGYGDWATTGVEFSFNVTLTSPTTNIDGRNPTFTWSDLGPDTSWYRLWVGPDDGGTPYTLWLESPPNCNGSSCFHSTGITLLSTKSYTWYIQPYGSYGLGAWSQGQAFGVNPIIPNPRTIAGCQIFPADNIWNTPVDTLPLDPNSTMYINTIGATRGLHMDFGSGVWPPGSDSPIGIPYVDVPSSQTAVPITFDYDDESDPGPYPIPPSAPIEGGPSGDGDRHVLVLERDNCLLYEVFYALPIGGGTSWTGGSGAIWDLSSNDIRGELGWTSADAAGLPILPGLLTYEEVASGEITHAIRFTVPQTRNTYVWPATHQASSRSGIQYPPMGQRFRLKANFDISGYSSDAQVILQAMKTYGIILADNGSAWYISGAPSESWDNDMLHELDDVTGQYFEAVNVSSLMVNPLSGQVQSP